MKQTKKILLTLGAATIIATPIATVISCGNTNTRTVSSKEVSLTTKDLSLTSKDSDIINVNQKFIDAVTPSEIATYINNSKNNVIDKTMTAENNSYTINHTNKKHTFTISGATITIHAIGNDSTNTLTYTVTSITKGKATRANLSKLGGTITGYAQTGDEITVNMITQKEIYVFLDQLKNNMIDKTMTAVNNATAINSIDSKNTFTISGATITIHAIGNDSTNTLTYTVTSIQKREATRANLSKLGGTITGYAKTNDEILVGNITQHEIATFLNDNAIIDKTMTAENNSYTINHTNKKHTFTISGATITIHAIGNDSTNTLTYTVTSITKGKATRANLSKLGGHITGYTG